VVTGNKKPSTFGRSRINHFVTTARLYPNVGPGIFCYDFFVVGMQVA
jgi:hypothetical protein